MKFAICNEVYGDWPLDRAFAHAASLGYTGVEIAPFTLGKSVEQISSDARQQAVQSAATHGLEIIGLHWLLAKTEGLHLTTDDHATRQATAAYLQQLAQLCSDLGGRIMVLGSPQQRNRPPHVDQPTADRHFLEILDLLCPTLEELQVTLALEPLGPEEGNYLLTAAEARKLIQAIDSPWVRLHLDVKAMSTEPDPIPAILRASRQELAHFHANDPNRRGPGMGKVDFAPIFSALQEIGYDDWISVEVFDYSPGIEKLTADSLRYMQQIEQQLSVAGR